MPCYEIRMVCDSRDRPLYSQYIRADNRALAQNHQEDARGFNSHFRAYAVNYNCPIQPEDHLIIYTNCEDCYPGRRIGSYTGNELIALGRLPVPARAADPQYDPPGWEDLL